MYALLRAIAGVALRWYYSDIQIEGSERIPRHRPLLLVVNHPNALVDALLVGWIMPRRVLITAKSTIFINPVAGALLRWLGVLPLRRVGDEAATGRQVDASRNAGTFEAVHRALADGGCVLIFPEGRSPDEPSLAPLKTGAARMALHTIDQSDAALAILPIGLVFERKEAPRSRVLVTVGEAIDVREWAGRSHHSPPAESPVEALTAEIATRLRSLTLSYPTLDDAARGLRLARIIAALLEDTPPIGVVARGFGQEAALARRIEELRAALAVSDPALRSRAENLVQEIDSFHATVRGHGVALEDVRVDLATTSAARFVLREGWYVIAGVPVAAWGWLNHWLPLRAARVVAARGVESAADPAMRTIVAGAAFVVLAYAAQTAVVAWVFGWVAGAVYLLSLPMAADVNFALADRLRRARRRARTYLLFRRQPDLRDRLASALERLRQAVLDFDRDVRATELADERR